MVRVGFKKQYANEYESNRTYYFKDYKGATVGDIVVVDTVTGYGIGVVVEVGATHPQYNNSNVREVVTVINTAKQRLAAQEQQEKEKTAFEKYAHKIRKYAIIKKINELTDYVADDDELENMSYDNLLKLYKFISIFD